MGNFFSYNYIENDQWLSKQMRYKYYVNEDIKTKKWILHKHIEYKPLLFQKIIKRRKRR